MAKRRSFVAACYVGRRDPRAKRFVDVQRERGTSASAPRSVADRKLQGELFVSPLSIVEGGVTMVRREAKTVAIWTVLYLIVAALMAAAMHPVMAGMASVQQQLAANAAEIQTPPSFHQQVFVLVFAIELGFLILGLVAFAAVVRAAARPGGDRFAYLRFGMDELRLFGLGVLAVVAAIAAEIVAMLALALVAALARLAIGDSAATVVAIVMGIVFVGAAIWVEVRMSLAGAFTVLRGRIVIVDAWRATRGRFWTLFGAYVLLMIVFIIGWIAMMLLTYPGLITAYVHLDRQAMATAAAQLTARQAAGLSTGLIVQMVVGAVVMTIFGVVGIGSIATAAIALDGAAGDVPLMEVA